ncbi:MAG: polymer-forming cytoskeletal protein [Endomicrobium sp.]|jgi:cytoskeletal protein CcmA (bactofilin family)|nr:polymer-forming cytoskeletal protein [Endomicrobium sp.]
MTRKNSKDLHEGIETVIGQKAVIEGKIKAEKIRIDGKINGDVEASGILIGPDGAVKGNIKADGIMISGTVEGNIYAAEGIDILDKAKVSGDIETNLLTISEGAFFEGKSSMAHAGEPAGEKKK